MTEWRWVSAKVTYAIHDRLLAEHGGLDGVRDLSLVESALARPQHLAAYVDPDASALAAAYAIGLARNHGFLDGNKRTAWVVSLLFLRDHGCRLRYDPIDAIQTMQAVAAGSLSEKDLAIWFRTHTVPAL